MSGDYSNFEKDLNKKSVKKGSGSGSDFNQTRKKSKDYQVFFEAKGAEKNTKEQTNPNKGSAPLHSQDDHYGAKGPKHDPHHSHKPKPYPRKGSRDQSQNFFRRKHSKVSKDLLLEFSKKASILHEIDELATAHAQLFVKEKQPPVNHEVSNLDPNEGFIAKANYGPPAGTTATTTTNTTTTTPPTTTLNTATNQPQESSSDTIRSETSITDPKNSATDDVTNTTAGAKNEPITESKTEPVPSIAPANTTATVSSAPAGKPMEMFDFAQERHDPIQAMREKMKRDKANKEKAAREQEEANKKKEAQEAAEKLKTETPPNPIIEQKEEKKLPQKEEAVVKTDQKPATEKLEENTTGKADDEDKYSDIDAMYEKKLKNNEIEEPKDDAFSDFSNEEQGKKQLVEDDTQRPEWEDVDANQVIQEIKKEEFLTGLPQDKRTIFGDKYMEKKLETSDSQAARNSTRESEVDFSKVSFDNEPRAGVNENFNVSQTSPYDPRGRMTPQAYSQENIGMSGVNMGYNVQDVNQNAMYRNAGLQSMQQANALYANKGYQAGAGTPGYRQETGATSNLATPPKQLASGYPAIIFKYFSPVYDTKAWYYVDLEQKRQGPFSGRTMDEWYSKGYLPMNLLVTIGKDSGYKSLTELAEIILNNTTQGDVPRPKEQTQQKMSPTTQEQQYQQYYNQQQYPQQYPAQYQQQQQGQQYLQQQQYYAQQTSPGANDMQRYHPEVQQYGATAQAGRAKNYEGGMEGSNMYYGQYGASGQYGSQGSAEYGKTANLADPQTQSYYAQHGYYPQEGQQPKATPNYAGYKTAPTTTQSTSGYYQDPNMYRANQMTQPTYNQPQKTATTQWKGTQQQMANYPGQMGYTGGIVGSQMGTTGYSGQTNYREFAQGGPSVGATQYGGAAGGNTSNMMYAMQQQQQQQQQMMNKNPGMGGGNMGNQGAQGDMSMYLKNMLGMQRPSSRQEEPEY